MSLAPLISRVGRGPIKRIAEEVSALGPGGRTTLSGLFGSSMALLLAGLFNSVRRPMLAVLPTHEDAENFERDLSFFMGAGKARLFPSTELLPFELQPAHPDILASRIRVLFSLMDSDEPFITVVSAATLLQRVIPCESLMESTVYIRKGSEHPLDELAASLVESGYSRMSMVEERGEMSIRGCILDVFPPGYDAPLRVEFFGDEVESIRTFDITTQRSTGKLEEAVIIPAGEAILSRRERGPAGERLRERAERIDVRSGEWHPLAERISGGENVPGMVSLLPLFFSRLGTLFDYLGQETVVTLIDPSGVEGAREGLWNEVDEAEKRSLGKGRFFASPEDLYMKGDELEAAISRFPALHIEPLIDTGTRLQTESNRALVQDLSLRKGDEPLRPLAERIRGWMDGGLRVYLTAHNRGQAERTRELVEGYGLRPVLLKGDQILERKDLELGIAEGALASGFSFPAEGIVVVTEEEIFGERVKRRGPPSKGAAAVLTQLDDLSTGDYVVHTRHGIGLYRGLERLSVEDVENDFMLLEYSGGDRLYVPVQRLDLVSKYRGLEGRVPELDRLGGPGWERRKRRVKKAVGMLAGELLKLYAERAVARGFAFSGPDRLFTEFEASFEYDETPDQTRAIEECMQDMESARPMDRLICGDVGHGKTEVAMRAAFRAVLDSKQVAVLVPTTILAQQHHLTFRKRFAPYPVTVEVISRFRSRKEQREVIERAAKGEVDILIGTHRLLQRDVRFRDLGLIVIDEEHRFGVAHKEKLKTMKKQVDVLSLTATPIPRTLQMSIAGLRDLSIISTPPEDRLAIKTSIIRFDEAAIREAIERELKRGGQVFFVHNRVQNIGAMEDFLRRIVPGARVAVAHGQMKERDLEERMLGFVERRYDILLSTTIIESGLDIPTANTIIINRADSFGLAELYQLRGRVGRSSHRAYAYFITPHHVGLTDEGRKRIEVIQELTQPGSGYRVAAHDLEIRGAGELLGSAQSGRIAEVGLDLYTRLLEEAVREMKGEEVRGEAEPEINLRVSQYIPDDYVEDTRQRLNFYKRLASVSTEEELSYIRDELLDRYGELPVFASNLVSSAELRLLLKKVRARDLAQKGQRLYITFDPDGGREIAGGLMRVVQRDGARFRLTPDARLIYIMKPGVSPIEASRYVLKEIIDGCYI